MTKAQLTIFLQLLCEEVVEQRHIDEVYKLLDTMSTETKEKFIAYDLYKDMLLKEKEKNAEAKKTP